MSYKQERNKEKWLIGLVILIVIATIALVTWAVVIFKSVEASSYKQGYLSGYSAAKLIYESQDFEYNEEKLLKD